MPQGRPSDSLIPPTLPPPPAGPNARRKGIETPTRIIDSHYPNKHVRSLGCAPLAVRSVRPQHETTMIEDPYKIRKPRKRRLLVTTKIELKAMAPAASIGLRN